MSGTSLDGVDATLVDFSSATPRVLATAYQPYAADLRRMAMELQARGDDELHRAAMLGNALAHAYADVVNRLLASAGLAAGDIRAIGCHGQTVRHQPGLGYTVQVNNPALLAELSGITVVADFRSRDIAAGGQGAPLVPAFHAAMFSSPDAHRTILNLGGIANVTDLAPGRPVRGFDCGPGNMLLDAWCERHLGKPYDEGGSWAAGGTALPGLLDHLLADPYFASPPPKSCGRDEFNLAWLDSRIEPAWDARDVQATLLELTVQSVLRSIDLWLGRPDAIHVCGGGARNAALMARLETLAAPCRVASTDSLGLPADVVEAAAFAWLAWRTLENAAGNLPQVTGARGARVLGAIYPH
jgi:anhydro-N-acetylmuramic acid kinase